MQFDLYRSDQSGNAGNCVYQTRVTVTDAGDLKAAAAYDHVCAEYRNSYRSTDNFLNSDVIVMDLDNDHSEDPDAWITEEKLDGLMPDISYAMVPSRNHMKPKDGRPPRPKYHVYFPIEKTTDKDRYVGLKRSIQKKWPFFDGNALDAARFIYGASTGDAVWHDGWVNIDEDITAAPDDSLSPPGGPIPAGCRNNTMSRFAGRVIKRYGNTDKAHDLFLQEASRCSPPLPDAELDAIWESAVKFFTNKVQSQSGYVPPDQYNTDFENGSLKPDDYSDIGQAKVLSKEYGDELLFTLATDYMRYDGERWIENRQLAVGAIEEFSDLQLQDAMDEVGRTRQALIDSGADEDAVSAGGKTLAKAIDGDDQMKLYLDYLAARDYLSFAMKRRDYKYLTAALNAAKPMLGMEVSDLDKDEFLLNTPYATYDLRCGVDGEQPHDPRDHITKITEFSPGNDGEKEWLDALELFFCGDSELIEYVQLVVGMAAVGKVYVECLIISYGSGANGKSTFWNTIARVLGSYSGKLSAETLTVGCKRNVKPEMAELKGKRLVIASETEEGMRLNTSVVKQLCATDEILAEKKYKDPFVFTPSHTLMLYTNHLPKVGANDDGTWRRLVVIPFNAHITGDSDIKNYSDFLVEHSGPAIMKWIIEGAQKVIGMDFHFDKPQCVVDAINEYRENNDWLGIFLDECCDVDDAMSEKSGELYQQYRAYCLQNGEFTRSTTDFYAALELAGFERHKTKNGSLVKGLSLKDGMDFLE